MAAHTASLGDAKKKHTKPALIPEQVKAAVNALYTYLAQRSEAIPDEKKGMALFDEQHDLLIQVALKRTPDKARTKPASIPIPHSLYGRDGVEICLFTKDPQQDYRAKLEAEPVANVTKVIGITKLRKNYHEYADRRALLAKFDLFLADARIVPLLPALLGTKFFEKKKQPVSVDLTKPGGWSSELARARDSTSLFLNGPCLQVKVAHSSFTKQQVLENILAAVTGIVERIPKKWNNVQSIVLKTHDSAALPLYNSLPVADLLPATDGAKGSAKAKALAAPKQQKKKRSKNLLSNLKPASAATSAAAADSSDSMDTDAGESKRAPAAAAKPKASAKGKGKPKVAKPAAAAPANGTAPEAKEAKQPKKASTGKGAGAAAAPAAPAAVGVESKGKKASAKGTPAGAGVTAAAAPAPAAGAATSVLRTKRKAPTGSPAKKAPTSPAPAAAAARVASGKGSAPKAGSVKGTATKKQRV